MRRYSTVIILLCLIFVTLALPDLNRKNKAAGTSGNITAQEPDIRASGEDRHPGVGTLILNQETDSTVPSAGRETYGNPETGSRSTNFTAANSNQTSNTNTETASQVTDTGTVTESRTTDDAADNTSLTITATVTGHFGNRTKDFIFRVFFTDSNGYPVPAGTTFRCTASGEGIATPVTGTLKLDDEGKCGFMIKHGQGITIQNINPEYKIRITEGNPSSDYDVSFMDSEKNIVESGNDTGGKTGEPRPMTSDRTFRFTNERQNVSPTGIDSGDTAAIFPLIALILLIALTALTTLTHKAYSARKNTI